MPPRTRSYQKILQDSPMLNTQAVEALFPSKEDKEKLAELGQILDDSIRKNESAAKTWANIGKAKGVALKLLATAMGKPF